MRLSVKAKPGAKEDRVEKINDSEFAVFVKEPPLKGRANRAIIKLLADYFKISPLSLRIVSGYASKNKIIEIGENSNR